jgi:transcription elongation GreA/GreB family factor
MAYIYGYSNPIRELKMLNDLDKSKILNQLVIQVEGDLAVSQEAADVARDAAVNEESKSEDKHDTRSIEAGYLAGAQRKRVAELKELVNYLKILKVKSFSKNEAISATALVHLEVDGQSLVYFVLPQGGGLKTQVNGSQIHTVTPQTPLGQALLGLKTGEIAVVQGKIATREYKIINIA